MDSYRKNCWRRRAYRCQPQDVAGAQRRLYPGFRTGVFVAEIAIVHKAGREIAMPGNLLGPITARIVADEGFLICSETATAAGHPQRAGRGTRGQEVGDAAQRVGTVQRRSSSVKHFDVGHGVEWNRQIQSCCARLAHRSRGIHPAAPMSAQTKFHELKGPRDSRQTRVD